MPPQALEIYIYFVLPPPDPSIENMQYTYYGIYEQQFSTEALLHHSTTKNATRVYRRPRPCLTVPLH